jgi:uncharacterized protein YfaS (alpha-2-macroglobulin family)
VVRQPTPYTSLAFHDPADLPTTLASGDTLRLSFVVANHQGRQIRYAYVVTSTGPDASASVIGHATVTVPAGAQRTVPLDVRPVCTGTPCQVAVSLPGYSETIDALVRLTGSGS